MSKLAIYLLGAIVCIPVLFFAGAGVLFLLMTAPMQSKIDTCVTVRVIDNKPYCQMQNANDQIIIQHADRNGNTVAGKEVQ